MSRPNQKQKLSRSLLKHYPLPQIDVGSDKEFRGRAFVHGGRAGMAGGILLAAEAALRAGCGKVTIGCPAGMRDLVSVTIPEAYVASASEEYQSCADAAATLTGPGQDSSATLTNKVLRFAGKARGVLILDAGAIVAVKQIKKSTARMIITPHASEMAALTGLTRPAVENRAGEICEQVARKYRITVVLKGAETFVADPRGALFRFEGNNPGLAMSGSGDVLAGLMVGFAARGANALTAALWSVFLHARAGDSLTKKYNGIGFLAREMPAECAFILNRGGKL